MDMKLYIARHGQTDWNLESRAQGRTDVPLNKTGISQAETLRDKIVDMEFDICYASPLKRAAKTAEIIVNGKCPIVYNDLLVERCFGDFEGKKGKDLIDIMKADTYSRRLNYSKHNVESIRDTLERSRKFLEFVKSENPETARVLVVAHGELLKTLHFNIVGYDDDTNFREFHLENGELAEYKI